MGEINGREAVMRKRKIRKCGLERERKEQSSDILIAPVAHFFKNKAGYMAIQSWTVGQEQ